jgi:predicted RNase H-like HicB family nuclease
MNDGTSYEKVVEWSPQDGCYVGTCPALLHGGCHGSDARKVLEELNDIVDETLALYREDGKALPPVNRRGKSARRRGRGRRG